MLAPLADAVAFGRAHPRRPDVAHQDAVLVATHRLGWRLGERELLSRLDRLWSQGPGGNGALSEALGLIATTNGPRIPVELRPTVEQAGQAALQLGSAIRRFFEGLARVLDDPELVG